MQDRTALIRLLNSVRGYLSLELTNFCNLNCTYCYRTEVDCMKPCFMDRRNFLGVIRDIEESGLLYLGVKLNWLGESMLHPEYDFLYEKLQNSDFYEVISQETNLTVLNPVLLKKELYRHPLSLFISIDTLDQDRYLQIRGQNLLPSVLKNIETIIRNRGKNQHPWLRLQFIVMDHTEKEIEEIRGFARTLGISKTGFSEDILYPGDCILFRRLALPGRQHHADQMFKEVCEKLSLPEGTVSQASGSVMREPCEKLFATPFIRADGTVIFCSIDPEMSFELGNVSFLRFSQIWTGNTMANLRKLHAEKKFEELPEKCRSCSCYWSSLPQEFFKKYLELESS